MNSTSRIPSQRFSAFSIIELLLVVLIIGLLAAIVLPRASTGAETRRKKQARARQLMLQNALDQFVLDHDADALWRCGPPNAQASSVVAACLLQQTDSSGQANASGTLGPYLCSLPVNPLLGADARGIAVEDHCEASPSSGIAGETWSHCGWRLHMDDRSISALTSPMSPSR